LAPKKTNIIQKKGLPVPKQRLEKSNPHVHMVTEKDKENFNPSLSTSGKPSRVEESISTTALKWEQELLAKAAIPPEMQEAMLHAPTTPIKRVGALRRSPV
jgi:hypothetical protein